MKTIDDAIREYQLRDGWSLESAVSIARRGVPTLEYDLDSLLPSEDGPALVFGPPGSLKSWIALHAAGCIVTGRPFLGHFAVKRRPAAIYVNLDAGKNAFERRIIRSGFKEISDLLIASPGEYDAAALSQVFQQHQGAFVIIDTFSDAYRMDRADDPATAMRRFVRELRALYQEHGCNGLIIDHPHRPREGAPHGDYYGSVQKEATARIMWQVTPLPSTENGVSLAKIACRKMSEGEPFQPFVARLDFRGEIVVAGYDGLVNEPGIVTQGPPDVEIIAQVLRSVPDGVPRKAIIERTGIPRDRVRDALKERRFASLGKGPATRYVLRESYGQAADSAFDHEERSSESNGPNETLGGRSIQGDLFHANEALKSNGPSFDSLEFGAAAILPDDGEDTLL